MRGPGVGGGLDINTPKGRATLVEEGRAVELFGWRFPNLRFVHTNKERAAKIDGLLVQRYVRYLVLISCRRDCTVETFRTTWNWEWLLTEAKLKDGARLSVDHMASLVGWLYVVDEDVLLVQRLYDPAWGEVGERFVKHEVRVTETRRSVNGGRAVRPNAFIKMDRAVVIRRPPVFGGVRAKVDERTKA